MDPNLWESPDEFRPSRFIKQVRYGHNTGSEVNLSESWIPESDGWTLHTQVHHPNSYIPFGAGPRSCIGYKFALLVRAGGLLYLTLFINGRHCTARIAPPAILVVYPGDVARSVPFLASHSVMALMHEHPVDASGGQGGLGKDL